jgi:glycosyltransferase 2 family protein
MLKKILSSKILRALFSIILIYFAFRKINVGHLVSELTLVPKWFVVGMLVYFAVSMFIGGIRWSFLVIEKPKFRDFWNFTRATYLGGFYSLFFPTMVAGDMVKWLPLLEKYPNLSKTKLAASVLIDRVVGFSAFTLVGFLALVAGKSQGYQFPDALLWLFSGLAAGVITFYVLVFTIDFDKIFIKLSERFKLVSKALEIVDLLKSGNKKRILICFLISLVGEPIWMLPIWFYNLIFNVGISLLQVFLFVPVISLILVLPISVAGFGARENLFLYFFSGLGFADEKILLVSTFGGLMSILNALVGGLLLLVH